MPDDLVMEGPGVLVTNANFNVDRSTKVRSGGLIINGNYTQEGNGSFVLEV